MYALFFLVEKMHPVGFEPTHLSIAVLETAPLDHSGTNASYTYFTLFLSFVPPLLILLMTSSIYIFLLPYSFYYFLTFKNASGGVRTHASLDSRA